MHYFRSRDHEGELFTVNADRLDYVALIPARKKTKKNAAKPMQLEFHTHGEMMYFVKGKRALKVWEEWVTWLQGNATRPLQQFVPPIHPNVRSR